MTDIIIPQHSKRASNVRLIPDISTAAWRNKKVKEAALWYALRSLNATGSGVVFLDQALDDLIQNFGYSRRSAYRHLQQGNGSFFAIYTDKGRTRIKIYGVKAVCEYLNTYLDRYKHFIDIPVNHFLTAKDRRLRLWETIHKPQGIRANPISRDTIAELTGVEKRQQIRNDKQAKVKRTANHALCKGNKGLQPVRHEIVTKTACYYVNKRLPNIYHCKYTPGNVGMLRKVQKHLLREQRSLNVGEATNFTSQVFCHLANLTKRYFNGIRQLVRCKKHEEVSYTLIRSNQRRIKGRLEWEQVFIPCQY